MVTMLPAQTFVELATVVIVGFGFTVMPTVALPEHTLVVPTTV
jgi:hypothetical protein